MSNIGKEQNNGAEMIFSDGMNACNCDDIIHTLHSTITQIQETPFRLYYRPDLRVRTTTILNLSVNLECPYLS